MNRSPKERLVSVIIPCYNQARFLGEAIESVLAQNYPDFEIVVVDDGSTDQTGEIAAGYPEVRSIRQENQGPSAARNLGASRSRGEYLVFLDADDRLLPEALQWGAAFLDQCADCGFVSGQYRLVDQAGSILPTWREIRQGDENGIVSSGWELIAVDGRVVRSLAPSRKVKCDHYAALLQRNYIEMPSTVMYRQNIFMEAGCFDRSLRAAEDYDLFLRIARQYPVTCHNHVVADYRQHDTNTTRDKGFMLLGALQVLDRQWSFVRGNKQHEEALMTGIEAFFDHYGLISIPGPFLQNRIEAWQSKGVIVRSVLYYLLRKVLVPYRRLAGRSHEHSTVTGG